MNEMALVLIVIGLIVAVCLSKRRVRRPEPLKRLYPGVINKAEWMASDETVHNVEADYLAVQRWLIEAALCDYMTFLRDLSRNFSGDALREHEKTVKLHMRKRGPRLIGVVRAHHQVQVRRFSDDGQTCYVLDHQTERRMATYDYWTKRRLHTQDLGAGVYVYRMLFDRGLQRWKIDQFIQQLPTGWDALSVSNAPIRLTDELPIAAGRDI